MIIYLVKGQTGESDCFREWTAKAFKEQAAANKFLSQLNAIANKTDPLVIKGDDSQVSKKQDLLEKKLVLLDPKSSVDYTGTSYRVEELEVE